MTRRRASAGWRVAAAIGIGVASIAASGARSFARPDGDREAAAVEFREGSAAFARGDYRAAAVAFEAAYAHGPHGAPAYNAGLAWEAAGEAARAADAYDRAKQRGGLEPKEATDADRRLGVLERSLGRVDVSGPAGATVTLAHAERAELPLRIHVRPGSYEVHIAYRDGKTESRPVAVAGGAVLALAFEEPAAPPPALPKAAPVSTWRPNPIHDTTRHASPLPALAVTTLAAAAVASGAAIALGVTALNARDDYAASDYTDVGAYDRAGSLRTWTNVAWASAAIFAAAGAVLTVAALTVKRPPAHSRPPALSGRF